MPVWIDVFVAPLRDSTAAQVATIAVLILILLDWVFGIYNAMGVQHNFSSERMRLGIAHKCTELGFLLVALVIDATLAVGLDLGFDAPIYPCFCVYIAVMEIGSLLEIFVQMNPDLKDSPLFRILANVNR